MIQKIMQNPEFVSMVSELRGENTEKSTEDITGEMMAHLPDVVSMVAPMLGNSQILQRDAKKESEEAQHESEEKLQPAATSESLPQKYDKARAEKLLYAIKPYLSTSRCEIIDKCMSVMQLRDVVGVLHGLDSFKKTGKNDVEGEK